MVNGDITIECDMCHRNRGNEKISDTGYFTVGYETFNICSECGKIVKEFINEYEMKYINGDK